MAIYERQLMTKNNENKLINSQNYHSAVQLYHTSDGDIVYYAVYKDPLDLDKNNMPKKKRYKVGRKSEGITEKYTKNIRDEIVVKLRRKEIPDYLKKSKNIEEPTEIKEILTFGRLTELYLRERASNKLEGDKDKNIKNDMSILKNHLSNFLQLPAALITSDDIIDLKIEKLKVRMPSTVNNILILTKSIFNYGIEHKLIKDKPSIKIIGGIDNERERWLTKEEIFLIYDLIKDNVILSNFVKLSLSTGARLNTILSIKRKDINLDDKTVILTDYKRKSAGRNNQITYFGYISNDIINELSDFIKDLKPDDYIFQYANGGRVGVDYIQNNLQKLFDQHLNKHLMDADGKIRDSKHKVVIHTFRHTFATQLVKKNTEINIIKTLLNHTDIKTTNRYAKFLQERGTNAIGQLDIFK